MHSLAKFTKKAFSLSVVTLTIAWSMGLGLLVPTVVSAATTVDPDSVEAGDLVRIDGQSSVYYVNDDMERVGFGFGWGYSTVYPDFSGVKTLPMGTNLDEFFPRADVSLFAARPGSLLIKSPAAPTVFAIGCGYTIHAIDSEEAAKALYGINWSSLVRDFPDGYMGYFETGDSLDGTMPHCGQLTKVDGTYYVLDENGEWAAIDGTLSALVLKDVRVLDADIQDAAGMSSDSFEAAELTEGLGQLGVAPVSTPEEPPVVVTGGDLSVSLSSASPAGATLSAGTAYNTLLKVNMSAGSKAVKVSSLTIKKGGLIANSNISGVSAWSRGAMLGDVMTSFNSNNEVTLNFGGDAVTIPAGSTETFDVAFNFGTGATGGTVTAELTSASAVGSDGTVSGSFPVRGSTFGLTDGTSSISAVTLQSQSVSGLTEPTSATAGNVEIGETKDVFKVRISETTGRNDVALSRIRLYFKGTFQDKDVTDLTLVAPDGTTLATDATISGRYANLQLATPYTIPEGSNRVLTVRGKVADGSGNWFLTQIQNDYDVMVSDSSVGYYIVPTNTTTTFPVFDGSGWFKMKSGTLTVSKRTDSTSGNVTAGSSNVTIAKYDLKAVGEDIEIRKIGLQVATGTSATAALTGNVRVLVDGVTYLSTAANVTMYNSASTQYTLSQYLTIKSGETKTVTIEVDISSSALSTQTFAAKLGNMYTRRLSTLDYADNLPSSSLTAGNTLTVNANSITLAKDTSLASRNVGTGSVVELGRYVVQAGSSEGLCVSNATVAFAGAGFGAPAYTQNLKVMIGSAQLGSTLGTVATSSNSFSFSKCLAANEMATIKVYADVLSNAAGTGNTTLDLTYVGSTSNNSSSTGAVSGQNFTVAAANVLFTAASDSSTISAVRTPSGSSYTQLGKWKMEAKNDSAVLNKITFHNFRPDGSVKTDAAEFGTLALYDASNMATPLATGSFIPGTDNGYIRFTGTNLITLSADTSKYLVLMGQINGSGVMGAATTSAWGIYHDGGATGTTYMEIQAGAGGVLSGAQIDTGSETVASYTRATSTFYLYHNSVPTITAGSVGTSYEVNSQAPIFKYTITNTGDREIRISTTTINVSVTGLAAQGSSGTGTVSAFKLWEANASGGLATQIATSSLAHNMNASSGVTGSSCVAGSITVTVTGEGAGNCVNGTTSTINLAFGPMSDLSSLFDTFTIAAGGSRTFVMTADTTLAGNGSSATSGTDTITISARLDGATGFSMGDTTNEANWANGVVEFFYTPIGGSENSTSYTASDSYDVVGTGLSRSY